MSTIATGGKDYAGLPNVLSFFSGQTIGALSCIHVPIIDDSEVEGKENFTLVLFTNFPGVTVSKVTSVIEIVDNDQGKVIAWKRDVLIYSTIIVLLNHN